MPANWPHDFQVFGAPASKHSEFRLTLASFSSLHSRGATFEHGLATCARCKSRGVCVFPHSSVSQSGKVRAGVRLTVSLEH